MPRFTRFTPDCESYLMHCVAVLLAILLARIVYRLMHMADKPPWVHELADLGVPARKTKISGTAVICGGSISGVITARICSDHFERVVVVDPEITRSLDGKMKARVLQYDSMHGYLSFFTNGLRCLWPDFDVEVAAAGGITSPADGQSHYSGVPIPAPHDQYAPLPMPQWVLLRRPGMERLLQKLLLRPATSQSSHIQTIDGTVKGLIRSSKGNNSIESVVIQDLSGRTISLGDVAFIADCTGTAQAGVKWLKATGYNLPDTLRLTYNPHLQYMTITFTVSEQLQELLPIPSDSDFPKRWLYTFEPHYEQCNTLFMLTWQDDEKIQLLFGGWGVNDLPKQSSEIELFLAALDGREPIPAWLVSTIRLLAENGDPTFEHIRIPALSYLQYHKADNLPSNFISIGDASMMLNPIYGQGCTKALLGNLALNSMLAAHDHEVPLPEDFSSQYFHRTSPRMTGLWNATKYHDYGFPQGCEKNQGQVKT